MKQIQRKYAQKIALWSFLLFGLTSQELNGLNIIFDFGGVLGGTPYHYAIYQTGITTFLRSILSFNNPMASKKRLFEFLDRVKPASENLDTALYAKDDRGNRMPQIMCDWMTGAPTEETLSLIDQAVEQASQEQFFYNNAEKELIKKLAYTIFDPEIFVKTQVLYPEAIRFVQKCKQDGHKLYILSNYNKEAFALIRSQYSDFFALFDGIVVSGDQDVQCIKPFPQIFEHIMTQYDLNPYETIFIDDQQENLDGFNNYLASLSLEPAMITPASATLLCTKGTGIFWGPYRDYHAVSCKLTDFIEASYSRLII